MLLHHKWWARLALALSFFATVLACRTSDLLIAQQPTNTPTRTPRPTFTPLPKATDTLVPTLTPPPTAVPTKAPTLRPTARPATAKPPPTSAPPPVVVPPTAVPAPQMQYGQNTLACQHAGNQYIKGRVYDSSDPSANGVGGVTVALGGADGANAYVTIKSEGDGFYTFTLSTPGGGAQAGTYYVWLNDGNGRRISDIGGPINMKPTAEDTSCWAGAVDFWRRF